MSRFRQFHGPATIFWITCDYADPFKSMHPFGQVMVVLPVPLPFQPVIKEIVGPAFIQFLTDPEPACGWVPSALRLTEAAYPARTWIIGAVPAKDVVDLIDET